MKRNTLTTAVVAGLTGMAGMVSVSNAVNVSPDGTGQVLLYPYYSARGGNDTLVSIVNSTDKGKAVKIRFREAINSRDVFDFPIYLSAYDVWTGAVTATDAGGAKVRTADTTCTVPYIFGSPDGEAEFLDFDYNTAEDEDAGVVSTEDGGPDGIERTASGYIEVIEMGAFPAAPDKDDVLELNEAGDEIVDPGEEDAYVAYAIEHVNGVPRDCQSLVNAWTTNADDEKRLGGYWTDLENDPNDALNAPSGGLYGAASIINVADGTMFSYNATAIDNFFTTADSVHFTEIGDEFPNLRTSGTATFSNVFYPQGPADEADIGEDGPDDGDPDNNPNVVNSYWTQNAVEGADWDSSDNAGGAYPAGLPAMLALNATLTASSIANEYNVDPGAGAHTEWVVTMPTKRFHVDGGKEFRSPLAPFTSAWSKTKASCDEVSLSYWDREEQKVTKGEQPPVFSPKPQSPTPEAASLCREANVIRFAADDSNPDVSEIMKEPKRTGNFGYLNVSELAYTEGWAQFSMAQKSVAADRRSDDTGADGQTDPDAAKNAYTGLPVIGFAVTSYTNGNLGDGVLANYGGTFQHSTTRTIASS